MEPSIDERTGAVGHPDATVLNNYVSQATVSFNAQNVAIAKAIVSTSETSTAANNLLTIGEIVRYRVTLTVPEGQIQNLQIQDLLPTGLTFLNDGTATYQTNAQGSLTSSDFNTLPGLGVLPGVATAFDDHHVGSITRRPPIPTVLSREPTSSSSLPLLPTRIGIMPRPNRSSLSLMPSRITRLRGTTTPVTSETIRQQQRVPPAPTWERRPM